MQTRHHQLLPDNLQDIPHYLGTYGAVRPEAFHLTDDDVAEAVDMGLARTVTVTSGTHHQDVLIPGRRIRQILGTTRMIRPPVTNHLLQMACLVDIDLQYQEIRPDMPPEPDRRWRSLTARHHGWTYTYVVRPAEISTRTVRRLIDQTEALCLTHSRLILYLPPQSTDPEVAPEVSFESLEDQVGKHYQPQFSEEEINRVTQLHHDQNPKERAKEVKSSIDERIKAIWYKVLIRPYIPSCWPPDLQLL